MTYHGQREIGASTLKERLIAGSSWALAGKLLASAGALSISALVTRLLSPESAGGYFLALSLATAMALLAKAGLDKRVLQKVSSLLAKGKHADVRRAVSLTFIGGVIGAAGISIAFWYSEADLILSNLSSSAALADVAGLIALWTAVLALESLIGETHRGFHDIKGATLFGGPVSRVLIGVSLLALFVYVRDSTLEMVLGLSVLASLIVVIAGGVSLSYKVRNLTPIDSAASLSTKSFLVGGFTLLISNLCVYASNRVGLWIVGAKFAGSQIALYGAAERLAPVVGTPFAILTQVLSPEIGKLQAEGKMKRLERTLQTLAVLTLIPGSIMGMSFLMFGEEIMEVFFGDEYGAGGMLLGVLSLGHLTNMFFGETGYTLIMTGNQKLLMVASVIGVVVTVGLGISVGAIVGPVGVAIGTASGIVVQQVSMAMMVRRKCGIWTWASIKGAAELTKEIQALFSSKI